ERRAGRGEGRPSGAGKSCTDSPPQAANLPEEGTAAASGPGRRSPRGRSPRQLIDLTREDPNCGTDFFAEHCQNLVEGTRSASGCRPGGRSLALGEEVVNAEQLPRFGHVGQDALPLSAERFRGGHVLDPLVPGRDEMANLGADIFETEEVVP